MRAKISIFSIIAMATLLATANAEVPGALSYQSYLTNTDGSAVDGTVAITFAVYTSEVGGVPLWVQMLPVDVDQGLFSVALGNPVNPFPDGLFDTPLWIGITVESDGEMLPRRALTTAPFAFTSDNANLLQGQNPSVFNQSAHVTDTDNPHGVTNAQTGAASVADLASVQSQLGAATADITTLQNDLAAALATIAALQTALNTETVERQTADTGHDSQLAAIETNSVLALDSVLTLADADTALFSGVNLQVVNGTGSTSSVVNGLGNIIVGYDIERTGGPATCSLGQIDDESECGVAGGIWALSHKSGSHNIVVGDRHNYSSKDGIVSGSSNDISNFAASAIGGGNNKARANNAVVIGGQGNDAPEAYSGVFGGTQNTASGIWSTVSGGRNNIATGFVASVSGGGGPLATDGNRADADYGSVSGGRSNIAGVGTTSSSVSGGFGNLAGGNYSHVSGGRQNFAHGSFSVVAGGNSNEAGDVTQPSTDAGNRYSVVVGGQFNKTKGQYSVVSGGSSKIAPGSHDWVAGSLFQDQ